MTTLSPCVALAAVSLAAVSLAVSQRRPHRRRPCVALVTVVHASPSSPSPSPLFGRPCIPASPSPLSGDSRDQKSLERLRAERQEKIDELKERTNYYTTQQLIQRYDTDPAAKAVAASVHASKLGADSDLKMFLTDNFQYNPETTGTSNDIEPVKSIRLRRRNPSDPTRSRGSSLVPPPLPSRVPSRGTSVVPLPQSRAPSRGTSVVPRPSSGSSVVPRPARGNSVGPAPRCYDNEMVGYDEYNMVSEACSPSEVAVEHEDPAAFGAQDGGWIARVAALLVGEDPTQSYALICGNCHMHNGLYWCTGCG